MVIDKAVAWPSDEARATAEALWREAQENGGREHRERAGGIQSISEDYQMSAFPRERQALEGLQGCRLSPEVLAVYESLKPARKAAGRPRGTGLKPSDQPLVDEMHALLTSGSASSVLSAARQVAELNPGHSLESTAKRLSRRYREKYPASELSPATAR